MRTRLLIGCTALLITQPVVAQLGRRVCPGLKTDAGVEQQAVCWFEREQRRDSACTADEEGVSDCARQAATWCAGATMDEIPVINACFLAHLRAGELLEARSLERYLERPTPEVAKCQNALKTVVVHIRSVPVKAELLVDGNSYGTTPLELTLDGDWWKDVGDIRARFGSEDDASEVKVTSRELVAAFDSRSCVMGKVTIKAPHPATTPTLVVKAKGSVGADAPNHEHVNGEKMNLPAVISIAAGGAGIVTGGVLLSVALTRASDLSSPPDGTTWDEDHKSKYRSVKPLSAGGWVALGVGTALVAVGVLLITAAGSPSSGQAARQASETLALAGRTINWTGRF
jgi:hypothetical protein